MVRRFGSATTEVDVRLYLVGEVARLDVGASSRVLEGRPFRAGSDDLVGGLEAEPSQHVRNGTGLFCTRSRFASNARRSGDRTPWRFEGTPATVTGR
ncbi:hypothetical protein EA472_09425 [Natrarchaeobius oligotrophus]|uniref:Uncharacterized protein n=1 Tax=Natrarchaeobius chitinivorans TaxID=1679083 RepID=A0A3N6NMY8_NATCH|nr:hypothetical protein EA472_09425 [Natrarchaeobius chitinivorans]